MDFLTSRLRVGEKILASTALVGLLFLFVVWQYHASLQRVISGYQQLEAIDEAKETHAEEVEDTLLAIRAAERDFLLRRDPAVVERVAEHARHLRESVDQLAAVDAESADTAARIGELMAEYQRLFEQVVAAWREKGLDHDSGLQGAFRESVHRLEDLAGQLKVDHLYLQLMQVRRGEKDLGLRREEQYRDKVLMLVGQLDAMVLESTLEEAVREQLRREIAVYRDEFLKYSRVVLDGGELHGGKGPFRQAAHRIEGLLRAHFVTDMERNILQLRRREKDYLLRHDPRYVTMAVQELDRIEAQVRDSGIAPARKAQLQGLLDDYRRDFLALVEQNDRIDGLLAEMEPAATEVVALVAATVGAANQHKEHQSQLILQTTEDDARTMLWVVLIASVLGLLLAVGIARHIGHRVVRMAGLLDQLAREQPSERMPTVPGARNEVAAMAESVNAMADHKAHLLAWWKRSMAEADTALALARADAERSGSQDLRVDEALTELTEARADRDAHAVSIYRAIGEHGKSIVTTGEQLAKRRGDAEVQRDGKALEGNGRAILRLIGTLLGHHQ